MRRTKALVAVAVALMAAPWSRHWGYELSRVSGVRSGVLYPMLSRLLEQQWLVDGWEDPATISGRPPRRYYELTDAGRAELGALAASAPSGMPAPSSSSSAAAAPARDGAIPRRRPRPALWSGLRGVFGCGRGWPA